MKIRPVLTVSIPTFKRAAYLAMLLDQLARELTAMDRPERVEVLVSDNCSPDETQTVVSKAIACGIPVRYLRNSENIGSDRNIAQCFNEAKGRYVLIFGDDDLIADGMLSELVNVLERSSPGVVFLRSYGYDKDFRAESPGSKGPWVTYDQADNFLLRAGAQITLISACVIHKERLEPLDANQFVGGNLVQVHLVLRAILKANLNISYEGFAVACKRNNSGGYSFSQVFVHELNAILDRYCQSAISSRFRKRYESRLLLGFYPYYVWRQLRLSPKDLPYSRRHFEERFKQRWEYLVLICPMYILPRGLGLIWGAIFSALGRIACGDAMRGLHFLRGSLKKVFKLMKSIGW